MARARGRGVRGIVHEQVRHPSRNPAAPDQVAGGGRRPPEYLIDRSSGHPSLVAIPASPPMAAFIGPSGVAQFTPAGWAAAAVGAVVAIRRLRGLGRLPLLFCKPSQLSLLGAR